MACRACTLVSLWTCLPLFEGKSLRCKTKWMCLAENLTLVQETWLRYKLFWAFGLPINFFMGLSDQLAAPFNILYSEDISQSVYNNDGNNFSTTSLSDPMKTRCQVYIRMCLSVWMSNNASQTSYAHSWSTAWIVVHSRL